MFEPLFLQAQEYMREKNIKTYAEIKNIP